MRVNFDSKMLGDKRFGKLGRRLGFNRFEAYGRCYPVWNAAYENRSALMDLGDIDALAECEGFGAAMLEVDLAVDEGHGPRLRGVNERILWLLGQDAKRELANEAKRNALAKKRGDSPRLSVGTSPQDSPRTSRGTVPGDLPEDVPLQEQEQESLSPDQGFGSGSGPSRLPDPRPIVRAERTTPTPAPAAAPPALAIVPATDRRARFNHDAWKLARETHAKLRAEGIDPNAVGWSAMPSGAGMGLLVDRVRELLAGDPPDYDGARVILERRIAVAAAEARREGHLRWFVPMRIFDDESFWRGAEVSPEQVARPRASARGSPSRAVDAPQPRKIPIA